MHLKSKTRLNSHEGNNEFLAQISQSLLVQRERKMGKTCGYEMILMKVSDGENGVNN
jgi:hypothetical protein